MIEKRLKVPGGKLLVVKAEAKGGKVVKVFIEGDFFLHPEDKLELIEKALPNTAIGIMPEVLKNIIQENNIELTGITVEAICELMKEIQEELK